MILLDRIYTRIKKLFKRVDIKKHDLRTDRASYTPDNSLRDVKTADVIETLKKVRKTTRKKTSHRRIIKTVIKDGVSPQDVANGVKYEFNYHATKGWRKNRAVA